MCPQCGAMEVLRILYGHPNSTALALVNDGTAVLGGCLIQHCLPDWRCGSCRHEWFDASDPAKVEMEALLDRMLAQSRGRR